MFPGYHVQSNGGEFDGEKPVAEELEATTTNMVQGPAPKKQMRKMIKRHGKAAGVTMTKKRGTGKAIPPKNKKELEHFKQQEV